MSDFPGITPEMLRLAVEASADGMYVTDHDGTIIFANRAILETSGYSHDEFVGRPTSIFSSGRMTRDYYRRLWRTVLAGEIWREIITNRRADGGLYEASQTITPIRVDGEIRMFFAVQRDITVGSGHDHELRQVQTEVERMLSQQETLVAELHHRVKNDLLLTRSLLELQSREVSLPEARESLLVAADRAGVLARVYELLQDSGAASRIALDQLIGNLVDALRKSNLPEGVEIDPVVEPLEITPRVATSISIIVNELITNAAKHAFADVQHPRLELTVGSDERGIALRFADNGAGFPEAVLRGERLGFGLGIARTIAVQHDGTIGFANEGGAVVTVRIRNPR